MRFGLLSYLVYSAHQNSEEKLASSSEVEEANIWVWLERKIIRDSKRHRSETRNFLPKYICKEKKIRHRDSLPPSRLNLEQRNHIQRQCFSMHFFSHRRCIWSNIHNNLIYTHKSAFFLDSCGWTTFQNIYRNLTWMWYMNLLFSLPPVRISERINLL